ncbi:MAG: gamma-glutamylcyclotransferase family protein [Pseudomonadota bacterium]
MCRVFIYGSLKTGQSNRHWMAGSHLLGEHTTAALYRLYDLGPYPAALPGGTTALKGEVHALDTAHLHRLDHLENHPDEYERGLIDTPWGAAWIYLYRHPLPSQARILPEGCWPAV